MNKKMIKKIKIFFFANYIPPNAIGIARINLDPILTISINQCTCTILEVLVNCFSSECFSAACVRVTISYCSNRNINNITIQ